MSKYLEAAEAAKNLNKMVRGVLLVGEMLEQVGSLEYAAEDAKKHATKAREELAGAKVALEAAQAAVSKVQADAEAREARSKARAEQMAADAQVEAARVIGEAQDQAAGILAKVADESARKRQEVDGHVAAAGIALDEASKTLDGLNAAVSKRKAELEAVEKNLAKAKAEAARIFGLKE